MKRFWILIILITGLGFRTWAQTTITITDIDNWRYTELKSYVGQTIRFATPMYVTNNYNSNSLSISPRRIFTPTNQAYPMSAEYDQLLTNNAYGVITLTNVSGYHRIGEQMVNLTVKVNSSNSVSLQSCEWVGNSREEVQKGYDKHAVSLHGEPSLIVCTMNLEYYIVENLGTGYGPDNNSDHQS